MVCDQTWPGIKQYPPPPIRFVSGYRVTISRDDESVEEDVDKNTRKSKKRRLEDTSETDKPAKPSDLLDTVSKTSGFNEGRRIKNLRTVFTELLLRTYDLKNEYPTLLQQLNEAIMAKQTKTEQDATQR